MLWQHATPYGCPTIPHICLPISCWCFFLEGVLGKSCGWAMNVYDTQNKENCSHSFLILYTQIWMIPMDSQQKESLVNIYLLTTRVGCLYGFSSTCTQVMPQLQSSFPITLFFVCKVNYNMDHFVKPIWRKCHVCKHCSKSVYSH